MATPPEPGKGPRIRARARGGTSGIRPEVADALGGVERSLSEVAKWEQMLAGRAEGGPAVPALPEGYVGLSSESLAPPAIPDPDEIVDILTDHAPSREGGLLEAARRGEEETSADQDADDEAAPVEVPIAPLLTEFQADEEAPADDAPTEATDGSVLWAARTVEPPSTAVDQSDLAIRRRRRNARILSWAGAVVLIAGAALWLVPDRSSNDDDPDDELPALDVTSTTRSRTEILESTNSTLAPVETTVVTTPETTPTTAKRTTATTRRATPTTQATTPTTTPSSQLPVPPVGTLPGPGPNRTVPTTPTTRPPATTTTVAHHGRHATVRPHGVHDELLLDEARPVPALDRDGSGPGARPGRHAAAHLAGELVDGPADLVVGPLHAAPRSSAGACCPTGAA